MKEILKKLSAKEASKYRIIMAKVDNLERCSMSIQKDCLASFENGTIAKTNVEKGSILLINKEKEEFNLNNIVPDGFDLIFVKKNWACDKKNNVIKVPAIFNEECLFLCLHEIGHAWDFTKVNTIEEDDTMLFKDKFSAKARERFCMNQVRQERNAWTWALKQWKNLVKLEFVERKVFEENPIDVAKAMLFSYAKLYSGWRIKNHSKFLNKDLN
jgi:hypothetical protein